MKRLGRSPDCGYALVLATLELPDCEALPTRLVA
jgi:hypothetical protein